MACGCGYRKRLREDRTVRGVPKTHYLDCCATTPVDPRAIGAFERACRDHWGNPSSAHARGIAAADRLEECRAAAAAAFALSAEGIAFCSSGSEALHAALWGLVAKQSKLRFVTGPAEHASIRAPLRLLRSLGREVRECPIGEDGRFDLNRLEVLLSEGPAVLAYSPVNHETGAVQDAAAIAALAAEKGTLVLMDAVQTAPRLSAASWAPYADLCAVSAHKLYSPKGSAFLWTRKGIKLRPFRWGGGQEGGLFPGTENLPGIAAFAEASRLIGMELAEESLMMAALERDFLLDCKRREIELRLESPENHAPGVFCVSLPWASDMEDAMTALARAGICASRFSACSDRMDGPSRVLLAMGREKERSSRSLRIGLGRFSAREDLTALARVLETMKAAAEKAPR